MNLCVGSCKLFSVLFKFEVKDITYRNYPYHNNTIFHKQILFYELNMLYHNIIIELAIKFDCHNPYEHIKSLEKTLFSVVYHFDD